jgi:hypothetical protein
LIVAPASARVTVTVPAVGGLVGRAVGATIVPDGVDETPDDGPEPVDHGTLFSVADGPFDLRVPGVLDAYAEALEGWGEALAWLRGVVDFSSDLRPRPY